MKQCAINLQDEHLLTKVTNSDLIAVGAKYHSQCLVSLYNMNRQKAKLSENDTEENNASNMAFAELISHIQTVLQNEDVTPVFKLSELRNIYDAKVKQVELEASPVHSTRLKNKILSYFPMLEAHCEGCDVLLVPTATVGTSLRKTCQLFDDNEAQILSQAANIVRRDMFQKKSLVFDGSFSEDCQEKSVSPSLLQLINMILFGSNAQSQANAPSQCYQCHNCLHTTVV